MGIVTLFAGLLLPWLGGALWLIFLEARLTRKIQPNLLRQAGYGFFIGYAVLFLAIVAADALTGVVVWLQIMVFLMIFATLGGIAVWLGAKTNTSETVPETHKPLVGNQKALVVLLLILISFHLFFFAVEILTQPVYPWDAWFTWVYRAKIWFSTGHMAEIVSPAIWAASKSAAVYSVNAWSYPLFASVVPFWSALSLGQWSATLVNLPVLLAGIAMGFSLYGQCRETGFSQVAALIICYLLFSIPVFGTHIALAGYADIWMAGYVGLGFIAVMRGATTGPGTQTALGFLMIMFSMLVKNEGAVWLIAAVAFQLLLIGQLRLHIIATLLLTAVISIAFLLDVQHLELPFIGILGIVDNQLVIPFIGSFQLEMHNVWQPYLENFFTMGSWNLLWVLVLFSLWLAALSLPDSSAGRERRTGVSFTIIFFATQIVIFGMTDAGDFAEQYTAINRLPLHFVPAIIFSVALIAFSQLKRKEPAIASQENQRVQP